MSKRYSIEIDDGKVEVDVYDQRKKKLGVLRIDPNDFNIFDRLEKAEGIINNAMKRVDNLIKQNAKNKVLAAAIKKADEEIKHQLDIIFDYKVSQTVFKNTNCLSTHRGVTMIEEFIERIFPILLEVTETEQKVVQSHIDKHTAKYAKRQ